eukprot:scpid85731/ scgid31181/ 
MSWPVPMTGVYFRFVFPALFSIKMCLQANLQHFLRRNVSYGWPTVGASIRKQYRDIGQCSLDPKMHSPLLNSRNKCYIQADPIVLLDNQPASKSYQRGSRSNVSCATFGATLVDTNQMNNYDTSMDQWHQCAVSNSSVFAVTNALGKLLKLSTAWILLGQSSTDCYKHLGNLWLYKINRCSMEMLKETYIMKRLSAGQSDSALQLLAERMGGNNVRDLSNVIISGSLILAPWSHFSGIHWSASAGNASGRILSRITLYPAPGEHITVNIRTYDDLLSTTSSRMKVQIISEDDVYMLRYGARDRGFYEHLGEMYFISSSPLTGIALGGEPGARGYFRFRLLDDTA